VTGAGGDAPPVLHPIQLVDVHCFNARAEFKAKEGDPEMGAAGISLGLTELDEERRTFRARLDVKITGPGSDPNEVAELFVVVQGTFTSETEISNDTYRAYTLVTPVALLWPYARAYLAQLGSMLGASLPPLPSLDVLGLGRADEAAER
jgi:preprotein translocase subunit SecB